MKEWATEAEKTSNPVFGVNVTSVLYGHVNVPFGIPIDYMHAVLEGVTKTLLKCWFQTSNHNKPYYLKRYISKIDKEIS